jgi:hypothetical protein
VFLQSKGAPVAFQANTNPPLVVPPGASVPHLQHVLERLARFDSKPGPTLTPWALDDLPRGNTVVLAASDVSAELDLSIRQFEDAGIRVLLLLATNLERPHPLRRGAISITPGCDLAAVLEGRA